MMPGILTYTIGTLAALFPIANPIGAVPIFSDTRGERRQQAQKTTLNVIAILAVLLVGGRTVLEFFGISLNVLRIAGGLLVSHAAWEMVTSQQRLTDSEQEVRKEHEDISFTPMAILCKRHCVNAVQLIADGVISLFKTAAPNLFR
jgi:multiple antibiotic resistance protein